MVNKMYDFDQMKLCDVIRFGDNLVQEWIINQLQKYESFVDVVMSEFGRISIVQLPDLVTLSHQYPNRFCLWTKEPNSKWYDVQIGPHNWRCYNTAINTENHDEQFIKQATIILHIQHIRQYAKQTSKKQVYALLQSLYRKQIWLQEHLRRHISSFILV